MSKRRDIVFGVAHGTKGMHHYQCIDESDVRPSELVQWKGIVVMGLSVDNRLKLPLHDIGGKTLSVTHCRAIK